MPNWASFLWEARQQCPELVCVPAHYDRYLRFSALAKNIYISYTDQVEAFGLDECWLDVTGSTGLFGDGITIANDIRARIRRGIEEVRVRLSQRANRMDAELGQLPGGSRPDIEKVADRQPALCESVAARLREQGCVCGTVTVGIRTSDLTSFDRQRKLPVSTDSTLTIWEATVDIFRHSYTNGRPVRSLSVKASGLSPAGIDASGAGLDLLPGIVGKRVKVAFGLWLTVEQGVQIRIVHFLSPLV